MLEELLLPGPPLLARQNPERRVEIEPDGPADGVRRGRREPQAGQRVIHADHDAFGGIRQREIEVEEDGAGGRDGAVKVGPFRHLRVRPATHPATGQPAASSPRTQTSPAATHPPRDDPKLVGDLRGLGAAPGHGPGSCGDATEGGCGSGSYGAARVWSTKQGLMHAGPASGPIAEPKSPPIRQMSSVRESGHRPLGGTPGGRRPLRGSVPPRSPANLPRRRTPAGPGRNLSSRSGSGSMTIAYFMRSLPFRVPLA